MSPEELAILARLEEKIDRLEAAVARWLAILPDPDTLRGKLARRKMASVAADLFRDE